MLATIFANELSDWLHHWGEPIKGWFEAAAILCALLYFFVKIFLQKMHQRLSLEPNLVVLPPAENNRKKTIVAVECKVVNKGSVRLDIENATYRIMNNGKWSEPTPFERNISRIRWWSIYNQTPWSVDASSTVRLHRLLGQEIDAEHITVEASIAVKWSGDTYIAQKVIRL